MLVRIRKREFGRLVGTIETIQTDMLQINALRNFVFNAVFERRVGHSMRFLLSSRSQRTANFVTKGRQKIVVSQFRSLVRHVNSKRGDDLKCVGIPHLRLSIHIDRRRIAFAVRRTNFQGFFKLFLDSCFERAYVVMNEVEKELESE